MSAEQFEVREAAALSLGSLGWTQKRLTALCKRSGTARRKYAGLR